MAWAVSAALVWNQYGVPAHDPSVEVDHSSGDDFGIIPPLAIRRGLATELSGPTGFFQEMNDLGGDVGRVTGAMQEPIDAVVEDLGNSTSIGADHSDNRCTMASITV